MPYIQPEAIQEAKRMDALTWLKENEPWNLIRLSINNYCTAEHDSLKLSNGKWYWFSRGFGGVCALDYLMKVKEYSLPEAVEAISGMGAIFFLRRIRLPKLIAAIKTVSTSACTSTLP